MSKEEKYKNLALKIGFDIAQFCDARTPWNAGLRLEEFVTAGNHGQMQWLETTFERRSHPLNMWNNAKGALMLGLNYAPHENPLEKLKQFNIGNISCYAQNDDYHDLIKKRLKIIAGEIHRELKCEVKVFVDTAPLMEKPLAMRAGIGWQGKHTNLVSREFGSFLFLGAILIDHEFEYNKPEIDNCGTCSACIDICPTGAIIAPYKLDARLCISYLNIEHQGEIAPNLMEKMGNRIYGCDDCLSVCPWNKFAKPTIEAAFLPRQIAINPDLEFLLNLDDAKFREFFRKSPIKRIGINRFLRNVLIAIGNSKNQNLLENVEKFLQHEDIGIRAAANFAFKKLENGMKND